MGEYNFAAENPGIGERIPHLQKRARADANYANRSLITVPPLAIFMGRPFLAVNRVSSETPSDFSTLGHQILRSVRLAFDLRAVFVRLAHDHAAFETSPANDYAPRPGKVIATGVAIDARRTAEFAHPHDGGRIEQPAVFRR